MPWLHRFALLLAGATLLLVTAGGMVTSTESGLSVPDWPTTYGYNMFTFPLENMVGGIYYEHGHRLIASVVGMMTIGLVVWLFRVEDRRWVRWLGVSALAAVILQGVLGGLTVLYFLPAPVSIGHAGLAQLFFCLTVSLALFTSPGWRAPAAAPVDDGRLRKRLTWMTALVYGQILLGATMRHTGAGLAIPDFPFVFGGLWPPTWSADIAIHYAHRVGALVVATAVVSSAKYIWKHHAGRPELGRPLVVLLALITVQIGLGALVVLTGKQPLINTLHVATGALVLVTSVVLTLRAFHPRLTSAHTSEPDFAAPEFAR